MRTTKNTISPVEFRVDPLGLDRLRWLKSFFSAQGENPSNSVIIRRALSVYLEQVEKAMKKDDGISLELIRLKAHTNPDDSPWVSSPRFNGKPFSKVLAEERKRRSQKAIDALWKSGLKPQQETTNDA